MVGNQPRVLAGGMTEKSSAKQARFMRFCDCFNIPIILLADTPGYIPGTASEKAGIIRSGAKILYAQCEATVPKIAIICRKAYGGGQNGMGVAPGMGTDFVFCWPTADVGVMGDKQTVELLYSDDINKSAHPDKTRQDLIEAYRKRYGNPFEAASLGRLGIEDVFAPRETRRRLIQSLRLLQNKRQARYTKRHGNIPL
jgi:acetyl-CoA carboxylase carboxyltransferase component